jgi:cytochrome c oxidase cbb3-type subunit 3
MRRALLAVSIAALLPACERETRRFREIPPSTQATGLVREAPLQPGYPSPEVTVKNPYEQNAYALAEGKRLFDNYNCSGCHAHGGGGMGPPLMDDVWIYGSEPQNIVESILEGRPNGMPSFAGRVPVQQAWQLTAYVRSMSGLVPRDVASGRSDHMTVKRQEQSEEARKPKQAARPPAAEMP